MRLALIADFRPDFPPHAATQAAVLHAAAELELPTEVEWIGTGECEDDAATRLAAFAGVWIAPGSPYESLAGALAAIRFAREHDLPLLGTCGGFQHVVLEFARHVLGLSDAAHAEYDPDASRLFIARLACSLVGKTMQVRLSPGSRAATAYGTLAALEEYYCNFGINPAVVNKLFDVHSRDQWSRTQSLTLSGVDLDGEPRVIELPAHKFFVATLFVPQMRSRAGRPHPLVTAWLQAASG